MPGPSNNGATTTTTTTNTAAAAAGNPLDDLEGVVIHQTKRVVVHLTEKWIRASDMKVLKTHFRSWEENEGDGVPGDARRNDDVVDVDVDAPAFASDSNLRSNDAGSRPYAADVSSPERGGGLAAAATTTASSSSRDSLFKPKRPAGSIHG